MSSSEENSLIDLPEAKPKQSPVKEMILWWERKRWIYNLVLVLAIGSQLFQFSDNPVRAIVERGHILPMTVAFIVAANLFYTLGWGFGALFYYLFKLKGLTNGFRWAVFVVGILFSLLVTSFFLMLILDPFFVPVL